MDLKKRLGSLMALFSVVLLSASSASLAAIGTEEMPQSLKNKR